MQVTRQQLYDQVWSKPIHHLAKEFGLPDVGLSNLCRRHNIPLPPMGYWMKVSHGIYPPKPPLSPVQRGLAEIIEIVIKQTDIVDRDRYPELFKEYMDIKRSALTPDFPFSTNKLHPLLQETQKYLKKAEPDFEGRIWAGGEGCPNLHVSPGTLDRALKIMHALFKLFESQGFAVSVDDQKHSGTRVTILGEVLRVSLFEHAKRSEKVQSSSCDKKHEFHPSGVFSFGLDRYGPRWRDTGSKKLEDKLLEINEGLINFALRQKIRDLEWEEGRRKKAEEMERLKAEEQKRKEEEARLKKLISNAKDWHTSQLIRSYLEAVKKRINEGKESSSRYEEIQEWFEWAEGKADELDPVLNSPQM